jgi:iron complex transport system ATP-binding protein
MRRVLRRRAGLPAPVPPGADILAARELGVRLGGREVLGGVSASVGAGELLALVGPNGAGKSTLLGAFAGELAPHSGSVTVDGRALPEWRPVDLARRRALLPQHSSVAFGFVVRDVVAMGRAPWSGTPASLEDDDVIDASMAAVGLVGYADRSFHALSGGERARVALARVLAQRTAILLLDEPTAALDIRHQELVLRLAAQRAAAGAVVVVVLHDLGLAAAYATRVALLHHGRVVADGPPARVLTSAALSEVYEHPISVVSHPRTGELLVLPARPGAPTSTVDLVAVT